MRSPADATAARAAYEAWHEQVNSPDAEAHAPWHDLLFEYQGSGARAGFRIITADAIGQYVLSPGRLPYRASWLESLQPLLWPFGLHSIVVAEKR